MLRQNRLIRRNSIGKISKNQKFYLFKNDPKLNKKHLQDLKNPRKTILSVFQAILDENRILKKKVAKFSLKSPKSRIL